MDNTLRRMNKAGALSLLVLLLVLFSAADIFAARRSSEDMPNYIKTTYSIDEGLPTDEANAVTQDADGYLWIGGYGGLIRYDGSSFVDYSDHLESSAIRSLYSDSARNLYVGTNDGGAYIYRDDQFVLLTPPDPEQFLCIRRFAEDSSGNVYLASTSGIARVGEDTDTLEPIEFDEISNEQFVSVAVDKADQIWALSDDGKVFVLTADSFLKKYDDTEFFGEDPVTCLCSDMQGRIIIGSEKRIVRVTIGEGGQASQQTYLSAEGITSISKVNSASDGSILVCGLRGFGRLAPDGTFECIDKDTPDGNWAAMDHEGNYWVVASGTCLQRFCLGCYDSCNFNSTLGGMGVNVVFKEGNLFYVGTDIGVFVYDSSWTQVNSKATRVLNGVRVRCMGSDDEGKIWFSKWNEGVMSFDPATGETQNYTTEDGLLSEKVRVIMKLSDGRMLFGTQQGVSIMKDDKVEVSYGSEEGLTTTSILCAMELNGKVYVGTDGAGIFRIDPDGLTQLAYKQGLTQGVVLRMEPDSDGNGNFFVCAGDKLFYFECEKEEFRLLTGINKGAGSFYSVYDVDGRLWALQNSGIFSVDKKALLAGEEAYTAKYGTECGLTGLLSANTWCYLSPANRLYIPTHNGISAFGFEGKEIVMPRAIVNSITVDGKTYEHPAKLEIPSSARRVTADIALLLFSDMMEYQIGYRLDGFDSEDTISDERHVNVSYTNLRGGEYAMKIRILNPLTGETADAEDLLITKETAFRETPWFWVLIIAGVVAAAFAFGSLVAWLQSRRERERSEQQAKIIDEALRTMAGAIDAKDKYTNGHSRRVAEYSREIARRLNWSEDDQQRIYYIGLLHDIGKIGVPDEVLNKKGRLTDEEFKIIKQHPATGGEILKHFTSLDNIADGAKYHHERYDGRGYCEGKAGEDIPIVARIIGVADSYDAMQSNRVYRPGLTDEVILSELKKNAGTQFDPNIVPIMCEMIADGTAPLHLENEWSEVKSKKEDGPKDKGPKEDGPKDKGPKEDGPKDKGPTEEGAKDKDPEKKTGKS